MSYHIFSALALALTCLINLNVGLPLLNTIVKDDMIFPVSSKAGIRDPTFRWPSRTLVYNIDPSFSYEDIQLIKGAMAEISSKTCIRFRQRSTDTTYINIVPGGGCSSQVGKIQDYYQPQSLTLGNGCLYHGIIVHELTHAIGFEHEQDRPDRDSYVTVYTQNIQKGMEYNFKKESSDRVDTFGIPYDYDSIMHYEKDAFSVNGQPTILPKAPYNNKEIGQRNGLSYYDIMKINRMYGC